MSEGNVAEKFIGPRKVAHVVVEEMKTHGGNETVTVHYDGGFTEFMPKSSFEALATDKPTDFTDLGKRKIKIITLAVLSVLAEHDLKGEEIETLTNSVQNELYNSFNKATHYLWTKDANSFTPGSNAVLERSLLEAHRIITSIPNAVEQKADDAESTQKADN